MRKRTVNCIFDNILWYTLYMLPLVLMLISFFKGHFVDLKFIFDSYFGFIQDNIVFTSISSFFGSNGVLPVFSNVSLLYYFSYFICVYLVHLCVDFLLFLPRWGHKLLDKPFIKGGGSND